MARGGSAFGADIARALGLGLGHGRSRGLRGLNFDFEHKAGTHGRVNVRAGAYAAFLHVSALGRSSSGMLVRRPPLRDGSTCPHAKGCTMPTK